jgi:hypothetical protein
MASTEMDLKLTLSEGEVVTLKRDVITKFPQCLFAQAVEGDIDTTEITLTRPEVTAKVVKFLNHISTGKVFTQKTIFNWLRTETEARQKVGAYLNIPFLEVLGDQRFIKFCLCLLHIFTATYDQFVETLLTCVPQSLYCELPKVSQWLMTEQPLPKWPQHIRENSLVLAAVRGNRQFVQACLDVKTEPILNPDLWKRIKSKFSRVQDAELEKELDAYIYLQAQLEPKHNLCLSMVALGHTEILNLVLNCVDLTKGDLGKDLVVAAICSEQTASLRVLLERKDLHISDPKLCLDRANQTADTASLTLLGEHSSVTSKLWEASFLVWSERMRKTPHLMSIYLDHKLSTPKMKRIHDVYIVASLGNIPTMRQLLTSTGVKFTHAETNSVFRLALDTGIQHGHLPLTQYLLGVVEKSDVTFGPINWSAMRSVFHGQLEILRWIVEVKGHSIDAITAQRLCSDEASNKLKPEILAYLKTLL